MIKGILLGVCMSIFIVSLIFIFSSSTDILKENIITGNAIGEGTLVTWSFVSLIIGFAGGAVIVLQMIRGVNKLA